MLRWWDGTAWTAHTTPVPVPDAGHPPLSRTWGGLAVAVQAALWRSIAAAAFVIYVDGQIMAFVDDVRERPGT